MIKPRPIFEDIAGSMHSPEAVIVTGMRRTGKTTVLKHMYDKIKSSNKIFLDLENPLNRKYLEEDNYESVRSSFKFLGLDFSRRPYIFIDEIQFVKNIPSVAKYFIDHYKVKFFLTGSASFYMKNLFAESLAGRKVVFELHPLTFREFIVFKDSAINIPLDPHDITEPIFKAVSPLQDEYILFGGFPGVVLKNTAQDKKRALEEIFTSFFQMEILQLGDFRRNEVIRDLMVLLMQRIGSKLDIQRISKELGVSRLTVRDYIAFLESAYFVKTIRPFTGGKSSEIRKMPKIYACDSGLAHYLGQADMGHLFENSVFQNLRQKGQVNYYLKKSGAEIDFVLDRKSVFEVKLTPQLTDEKKLRKIAASLNMESSSLVSKNYSSLESVTYEFML